MEEAVPLEPEAEEVDCLAPWGYPRLDHHYFVFTVCTRPPPYVPGSGPTPQSLAPALSNEGSTSYIIERVLVDKLEPRFIIGYKDKPYTRLSVRAETILDYVSSWELEDYEHRAYLEDLQAEEDEKLPGILASENRKAKKLAKLEALSRTLTPGVNRSMIQVLIDNKKRKRITRVELPRKKPAISGRKRGRPIGSTSKQPPPDGPGKRNEPQPILTSPNVKRRASGKGLADHRTHVLDVSSTEDEDEDENSASGAIRNQLFNESFPTSRTDSPDPLQGEGQDSFGDSIQDSTVLQSSCQNNVGNGSHIGNEKPSAPIKMTWNQSSSTSTLPRPQPKPQQDDGPLSAMEALKVYQRVEESKKQTILIASKPAILGKDTSPPAQSMANPDKNMTGVVLQFDDANDDDDDEVYTVERILAEEMRMAEDGQILHYLIRWEGDWDDTWEPYYNVGGSSIEAFEATKTARKKKKHSSGTYK